MPTTCGQPVAAPYRIDYRAVAGLRPVVCWRYIALADLRSVVCYSALADLRPVVCYASLFGVLRSRPTPLTCAMGRRIVDRTCMKLMFIFEMKCSVRVLACMRVLHFDTP